MYCFSTAQAQPAQTWKTGQTSSYAAGDDGDLQHGVDWPEQRFEDNGDGTITDHLTGLIWLKNANCAGYMNWKQALTYCSNLASGSCGLTDGSAAGDWRLPNRKELFSLVDYSRHYPALPQGHLFDNVQSSSYSCYWSATTLADSANDYAWVVYMSHGFVNPDGKSFSHYVCPVRVGQGESPNDAILTDDFNDNSIDPEKWSIRIGGVRTAEEDGIMKIEQAATDNGGVLYSKWLDISPEEVITIERMAKVHYSNEYFDGGVSFEIEGVSEPIFVINYANYAYSTYPYQSRYGFFISRNGTNPYRSDQNPDDTSERIEPVWDTWFYEKVIYDPITGLLEYYINNSLQLTFNVGNLPELGLSDYRMQLTFSPGGWWTGHYHYMDDIIIYQEHSGDNLTISSPNGGDVLTKGQDYTITWNSTNVTGNIQIDLYKGGTEPGNMLRQLAATTENNGEYPFSPTEIFEDGSDYYIGISAENGTVWDFSDTPFAIVTDSDGDGVPNNDDNCPTVANPDQVDLDGDNIGNLCDDDVDGDGIPNDTDMDDDNDGMSDEWENQYFGLNPYLNDANGDLDGDGFTNLQEYQGGSDPTVPDSVPDQSPVIDSFTANLSDTWIAVETGEEIIFNCNAHDPDGEIYGYTIDFGDGSTPLTNQTGVMSYGYSEAGKYQATCAVVDNDGNTTISQAITVTATDPSHDITIKIQNENGEPLNGYLLFRDPPPNLDVIDISDGNPEAMGNYYNYFREFESDENQDGILDGYEESFRISSIGNDLKAVYVRNGLVLLKRSDIIYADDNELEFDKLTYLFFFETEQQNDPYMSDKMISERISFAENVCWWTLNINSAEIESRNLSQIVTVMGKNSWTETLDVDNKLQNEGNKNSGYFESHSEKMCFVLEPPLSCLNNQIKLSSTNLERPLILVHGINGAANYWEEDTPIPNKLRSEGSLLWEFYYRGQDKISDCANMLKKAIDIVSIMNSPTCDKVDIVTHSYGGVITRYYLSYNFLHPISNLLMIGPPHHGSYSAYKIYKRDFLYIIQRQGLFFDNSYLDFYAPIYEELIPGSSNLMSMEIQGPNIFSMIDNTLVLAGKKPLYIVGEWLHNEAPKHDDGLVSISSASLLDFGVDLGIVNLHHDKQRKHSSIVEIINDFLYDAPIRAGSYGPNKDVQLVIIRTGTDITLHPDTNSDYYRGGLIVETYPNVDSVEIIDPSRGYVHSLTKKPSSADFPISEIGKFFYYDNSDDSSGVFADAGLAYPIADGKIQWVVLSYKFSDGTPQKFNCVSLEPCRTKTIHKDNGFSDDSDNDGLVDCLELIMGTDPYDADSDDDGLVDGNAGSEDLNANGIVDQGETDPRATDTDGDGIMDGTEKGLTEPETEDTDVSAGFFVADADPSTTTDPTDADTDDDGILDGNEDKNHDGLIDTYTGETDPGNPDTDGDGIYDGTEIGLTEPQDPDATDISASVFVADADPSTTTDPTNQDSDGDGTTDGEEDKNRDGAYNPDEGETDPTVIEVTIDIKPGSDLNCFNNDGHGVIPLAILGSAGFDCAQIDPSTCTLSGLTLKIAGKSNKLMAHIEDVNNDGFDDLVLQIEDQDGAFQVGESEATLTGNLYEAYGGTPIQGTDSICIVP